MTAPAWFDICSPDARRAQAFYQEMFGWPVNVLDDGYALIGTPEEQVGGIGQDGPDRPYTGIVVYFRVDDLDAALDRADKLGGGRRMDPVAIPGRGRIAVFADPDGNAVGLLGP
jgi:predicted enzyme related to lactoylglutathione lyase